MLKEILENAPINLMMSETEINNTLTNEINSLIYEKCNVNLICEYDSLTSKEISEIVEVTYAVYKKILTNSIIAPENKIRVANSVMKVLFEVCKKTSNAELFFIKIFQKFTPAQIVSAVFLYAGTWKNYKWIINFFAAHKQIFPQKNTPIHTIGIYYPRIFNGGIERLLSLIIPAYMQMGYRVVLFNDISNPQIEYSLPQSEDFKRVVFSSPRHSTFFRLQELAELIIKYKVDLFISHYRGRDFPPFVQLLFCKLLGVKTILGLHASINFPEFRFPMLFSYHIADAVTVLSRTRRDFLKNFGINAYYIPNPTVIENLKQFKGRNPKKVSNTILWVGRIDQIEKNIFAVVPIMKEVVSKIPNAKLKIIGTYDNKNVFKTLQELIHKNNLESNIEFCGYHTDVQPFYEAADVMLNTSPNEGWSLVIAESKFYELPLVLYELPDNEFTRDGKGYISVPQGNFQAAAKALINILTDEKLRVQMSLKARESIQPFLNYDIGGAWKKIFEELEYNESSNFHSFETEQAQNILLEEIFNLQQKINSLTKQIKNK